MSTEDNVKIVQDTYRAFLRRDVAGILVHLDNEIIWTVPGSSAVPMAGVRKGLTEVRQFFETVESMLEFRLFEPREYMSRYRWNKVAPDYPKP
jgi:ketosteroid isomerase-like protein